MPKVSENYEDSQTRVSQNILKHKIKIVVPISCAFHRMDNFSALNNRCFDFQNEYIKGALIIRHFNEYKNEILNGFFSLQDFMNHSFWYGSTIKYQYLEFSFNIENIDEMILKGNENLSENERKSLFLRGAVDLCENEYKMFVFAFFLAFPVSTCFENGVILVDDKVYSQTAKFINSFDFEGKENIDLQKCWNYLHDSSKFKFGYSQNNASRFVSILSKMNETDDIITQIFYATMALEAVYARGTSEGIARQIIDKVKIFLNIEIEDNKLRQLYDIRSRYIHGDTDIELAFLNFDAVPGKEWDKLYALYFYASEILYKTAKRVIEENISEINFDYTVRLS
ncbi:MAG: hypothetical protein IKK38_05630 [Spirochaetaceae bacterium]|nr:hypothetical protein [Spirochaetaceae bacterium]